MAKTSDIPNRTLSETPVPSEILQYVPEDAARHYHFVPIALTDGVLEVGMVDPNNVEARDALQFIIDRLHLPFKIFVISQTDFDKAIGSYKGISSEVGRALGDLETDILADQEEVAKAQKKPTGEGVTPDIVEEAPVTKIVAVIVQHAIAGGASDIHIEPTDDRVKVRFRVDGALYTSLFLPGTVHEAIVARIKILTNMKLDEKRKPQDGRFSYTVANRPIDFRVSTLPTYFGEKVVMRILDPASKLVNLEALGLAGANLELVKEALNKPYGLILITGPTGSGKTTTLYSMLSLLDREKYNVVSLEDPIEYDIPGVNQSQVQPEIKYTFANGLRSIMRQDPDIIMVGEIRDRETAQLAIQAALTGHLVLSTLHTNNAVGVVPRLVDMGIDRYLIPPTLVMAIAQRLVPVLCPDSKEPIKLEESMKVMIDKQFSDLAPKFRDQLKIPDKVYRAKNSPTCPGGTKGRTGVFEVYEMDEKLEHIILDQNSGESEIRNYLRANCGYLEMKEDALLKAFAGTIPFEEVNKL